MTYSSEPHHRAAIRRPLLTLVTMGENTLFQIKSHKEKKHLKEIQRDVDGGGSSQPPGGPRTHTPELGTLKTIWDTIGRGWETGLMCFSATCTKECNLFSLLVAPFRIPGKATGCCNVSVNSLKSVPLCQGTAVNRRWEKKENGKENRQMARWQF